MSDPAIAVAPTLSQDDYHAIAAQADSLWQFLFMAEPPRNQADMAAADTEAMRWLDTEMMKRAQYMLPGVRRFVSCVHTDVELEKTLQALDESSDPDLTGCTSVPTVRS